MPLFEPQLGIYWVIINQNATINIYTRNWIWKYRLLNGGQKLNSKISSTRAHCVKTHWGRVTHICVSELTIIGSDNGLSPGRRQAIIWTNAGLLLIGPIGTNFSEILIEILTFSFKKIRLKVSSAKRRPFCLGLNVLTVHPAQICDPQCQKANSNYSHPECYK